MLDRLLMLALLAATALVSHADAARPPVCPGVRFVTGTPLFTGGPSPDALVLTSGDPQQAVRWSCGSGQAIGRAGRGGYALRIKWAACGAARKPQIRAKIDAGCTTMTGSFRQQGRRPIGFTAHADPCVLEPTEGSPTSAFVDCAGSSGIRVPSYSSPSSSVPALRVASIYESRSDHSFNSHPMGQLAVHVDAAGPMVLLLHSYEPTNFVVQSAGAADLASVIADGYYTPGLVLPFGVAGEVLSYYTDDQLSGDRCSDWSGSRGGCIFDVDPQAALEHTGLCIQTLDGCYRATQLDVH